LRRLTIDRYVQAAPSSWEKAFDNEGTLTEIDDFCAVQVALPLVRATRPLSIARSHD
jgi:hypothetical protein